MAYDEKLAGRVRDLLRNIPEVEEKKMFGGIAFMVNNKMCITVRDQRLMCRIDPGINDELVKRMRCSTVIMKGREYKKYVHVEADAIKSENDFNYWINLALMFNKNAGTIPKKK